MRCFERAAAADPDCAMAHWGIAYALGPNYNKAWVAFEPDELTELSPRARRRRTGACAARPRDPRRAGADRRRWARAIPAATPPADCSVWNDAYADAMRGVYRQFGPTTSTSPPCTPRR